MNLKEALAHEELVSSFDSEKIRLFKIWLRLLNLEGRQRTVGVTKGRLLIRDSEAQNSLIILLGPGRDDFRCGRIWITYVYGNEELQIQNEKQDWEVKSPKLTIHEKIQMGQTYVCFPSLARAYLEKGEQFAESHLKSAMAVQ